MALRKAFVIGTAFLVTRREGVEDSNPAVGWSSAPWR